MSGDTPSKKQPRRFWRTARIYFRRFRIFIWVILLALLSALIYLNQSGLPDFLKQPLLERLNARGIDLQFSRLRLKWYEGLVAENVLFGQPVAPLSPRFTAAEAKVLLNWQSLLKGQAQVDSLIVREGTFILPVADTNQPGRQIVVSNIQTQLRFLPQDQWMLDRFKATLAGARLELSANLEHGSAVREWPILKGKKGEEERSENRIRKLADVLDEIRLDEPSTLVLNIRGDAKDLRSFAAHLIVQTPAVQTPWGDATNGLIKVDLLPSRDGPDYTASIEVDATDGSSRWGTVKDFQLAIDLAQAETLTNVIQAGLRLSASRASSRWGSGEGLSAKVRWMHSVTNPVPLWVAAQVTCTNADSRWGSARSVRIDGELTGTKGVAQMPRPEWGWWTNLQPFTVQWDCRLDEVCSPKLELHHAALAGTWISPDLTVRSAQVLLYDGKFSASGSVNVESRVAQATASMDFDVRKAQQILTEGARRWIAQYQWKKPPEVSASAQVVMPAWTNQHPDWRGEVLPTLSLSGQFEGRDGVGYKGIEAVSARSHFFYSNMTWHLPDLVVVRPEGRLEAEHVAHDRTREYYWKIHSTVDPGMVRPLLNTNEARVFDLLKLESPPEIFAEVRGQFHRYDLLGARARVLMTNFSFRGESASRLDTEAFYTNKVVKIVNPRLRMGEEHAQADLVIVDLSQEKVFITNAIGLANPMVIARAIGPKVGQTMKDYIFANPPRARVNGVAPMRGEIGADLLFEVDGGPFHWWRFNIPRISGRVHWKDYRLSLSDVDADFYWGNARGNAVFDVSPAPGTEFTFSMTGTNILLQSLLGDLVSSTNKSGGWLDGTVVVTRANSDSWRTVDGHGELRFHDGLLWDIPLFGVLSPVLNGIMPGLGNSRATDGTCSYIITNGVFHTSDLDIRTPMMRLQYKGDVDMAEDFRVNARVEAELLKDMWVVGPVVSTVFWPVTKLFVYKVEGTLGQARLEPVNVIPKLMFIPFYPLRIFEGGSSEPSKEGVPKTQ